MVAPIDQANCGFQTRLTLPSCGLQPEVAVASRAELAESAIDPALLAIDRNQAKVATDFECVGREELKVVLGVRRRRP